MKICLLAFVALAAFISGIAASQSPSSSQYHIQTDEGPERYFRFQTDNGQFRKEKRLQDGTVIGTEAWIDAAGYLRQKDYIADKQGYRILKSKTIYVGQGRPIEEAIKSTKAAPAQSGILVDGGSAGSGSRNSFGDYQRPAYGYVSSTTSTTTPAPPLDLQPDLDPLVDSGVGKLNYLPPEEAAKIQPQSQLGFDHYPDELPRARGQLLSSGQHTPLVHIQPNAEPVDNGLNAINVYDAEADRDFSHGRFGPVISSTTPQPPLLSMLPPLGSPHRRRLRPRPTAIGIVASTPAPIAAGDSYGFSAPAPFAAPPSAAPPSVASGYHYAPSATPSTSGYAAPPSSNSGYGYYTPNSPLEVNSLEAALLPPLPSRAYRRRLRPVQSNHLDELSAAGYDGVGVTRKGFRYVLPKQYHEEETSPADGQRAGSFGYVDPFGIRRVVYYNASPGRGFVHRNNNQYVGANGAPYDEPGPAQLVNE